MKISISSNKLRKLYCVIVFFCYICSLSPWFALGNIVYPMSVLLLLLATVVVIYTKAVKLHITQPRLIFLYLLLLFGLYYSRPNNLNGTIINLSTCVIAGLVFSMDIKFLLRLLDRITRWMAILLFISLIGYLLYFLLGVTLFPARHIQYFAYNMVHHVIFNFRLPGDSLDIMDYVPRFFGIFLEPGHLTMGLIPLILVNRFDFRNKYVAILMIAQLFTMSLAGIITFIVGLVGFLMKRSLKYIVVALLMIFVVYEGVKLVYGADRIEKLLWNRLEMQDSKLSGDNRVTSEFEAFYNHFMSTDKKYFGEPSVNTTIWGGVSGYKLMLVLYGIFGVSFGALLYLYGYLISFKYEVGVLVVIYMLLQYQSASFVWFSVILMYVLGVRVLSINRAKSHVFHV